MADYSIACLYCNERAKRGSHKAFTHYCRRMRGCCTVCRSLQTRLIQRGETTEKELIASGFLLPAQPANGWMRMYGNRGT